MPGYIKASQAWYSIKVNAVAMRQYMDAREQALQQFRRNIFQQKTLDSMLFCLPAQFFGLMALIVQMQALDQELQGMQVRCLQRFASLA